MKLKSKMFIPTLHRIFQRIKNEPILLLLDPKQCPQIQAILNHQELCFASLLHESGFKYISDELYEDTKEMDSKHDGLYYTHSRGFCVFQVQNGIRIHEIHVILHFLNRFTHREFIPNTYYIFLFYRSLIYTSLATFIGLGVDIQGKDRMSFTEEEEKQCYQQAITHLIS